MSTVKGWLMSDLTQVNQMSLPSVPRVRFIPIPMFMAMLLSYMSFSAVKVENHLKSQVG